MYIYDLAINCDRDSHDAVFRQIESIFTGQEMMWAGLKMDGDEHPLLWEFTFRCADDIDPDIVLEADLDVEWLDLYTEPEWLASERKADIDAIQAECDDDEIEFGGFDSPAEALRARDLALEEIEAGTFTPPAAPTRH